MNLSQRIWNLTQGNYKEELEAALSLGIERGMGAIALSKQQSKYLQDFPQLQKDYKERYGVASDIINCEYRSMRLARTEINMAYRTAENERWQQMDFVVGYEIKCSAMHKDRVGEDICDDLAGKYPKDFNWCGWHPNCMCYKIPILKTEEEFLASLDQENPTTESVNAPDGLPKGFTDWVDKNKVRIEQARERGTEPYFIRDNKEMVDRKGNSNDKQNSPTLSSDQIEEKFKIHTPQWKYIDGGSNLSEKEYLKRLIDTAEHFSGYESYYDKERALIANADSSWLQREIALFEINLGFKKGNKPCLESINRLAELRHVSSNDIPTQWRTAYTELIEKINKHDYVSCGYKDMYPHIEKAYNIYKLSSLEDVKKLGFDNVSVNMPYNLLTDFHMFYGGDNTKYLASKAFYDRFDTFVPLVCTKGGCYYRPTCGYVAFGDGNRFKDSSFYRTAIQYHEFGHAFDHQRSLRSNNDLIMLFDEFKSFINKSGSDKFIMEFEKAVWKNKNILELNILRASRRSVHDYKAACDVRCNYLEKMCAISDTMQAARNNHEEISSGGHEVDYFQSKDNQLAEFIAHMSENYWGGNDEFEKWFPDFYKKWNKEIGRLLR